MTNDEYDIDSMSIKALIGLMEDKSESCPIDDHTIQSSDREVTDSVLINCNYSHYSNYSNTNAITHDLQAEPQQLANSIAYSKTKSNDNTKGKDFYNDKQFTGSEGVINNINIPETPNNNYDIILEGNIESNLLKQTVLYIMNLMCNNIYLVNQ